MADYYYARTVDFSLEEAEARVTAALKEQGFGVLTRIDVTATLKEKIGVDFRPYRILGACNPHFAHQALELEDKIGTMLPCNVILQGAEDGRIEVAAVDPVASMSAVENPGLASVALDVRDRLRRVIDHI